MTIYILFAYGRMAVNGVQRTIADKTAYRNEKAALEHREEFIEKLTKPKDERDLNYLKEDSLNVYVEHITLVD